MENQYSGKPISTKSKTVFIVIILIIIIVIILGVYKYFSPREDITKVKDIPTQKNVNFLGDIVPGGSKTTLTPLKAEGYENSWQTVTPQNYLNVARNSNVKWYNTESDSMIQADLRGNSFLNQGFINEGLRSSQDDLYNYQKNKKAGNFKIPRDPHLSPGEYFNSEFLFDKDGNTNFKPIDEIGKAALANARAAMMATVDITETDKEKLRKADKNLESLLMPLEFIRKPQDLYPGDYQKGDVVAKGGLLETKTPIPYVIIDGKEVPTPGINGLDYYANIESTQITGGSVANYAKDRKTWGISGKRAPLTGSYNSKSWYGNNPYNGTSEQTLSFGNTQIGYIATNRSSYNTTGDLDGNSGNGAITNADYERVAENCKSQGYFADSLRECIANPKNMAGQSSRYTKADLIDGFSNAIFEDYPFNDGVPIMVSLADQIATSQSIVEEAEIDYKEEVKKNAEIVMMEKSDVYDPMLIYSKFIGFNVEHADNTTPENYKANGV